jgi:DNA-binding response OmpR family regulator
MHARILSIERKRAEIPSFLTGLRKRGFQVETVLTGSEALRRIDDFQPDLVILNAASLRTNGRRICRALRDNDENLPIIIILEPDQPSTEDDCANVSLRLPFTIRKLVNRVLPFIKSDPGKLIETGPIQYDKERKTVRCGGKEAHLTPRLTQLLELLIEHRGEAVTREYLFKTVWRTQYTGDTRTLDVHISWLRQAIEEDPKQPVYLITIRGLGYRLDV